MSHLAATSMMNSPPAKATASIKEILNNQITIDKLNRVDES